MKTKALNILAILLLLYYCSVPSYIPRYQELDINPYGSFIKVHQNDGTTLSGELLSINSNDLVVLSEQKNSTDSLKFYNTVAIPLRSVSSFTLAYAQPVNYGGYIFLYSLLTISHGFYLLLSLPINLIVTISVTTGGALSYRYSDKDMTFEKLKMFARFPQGIPENIDSKDIKR